MTAQESDGITRVTQRGSTVGNPNDTDENLAVLTALGPIPPHDLGITMGHDHILLDAWEMTDKFSYSSYFSVLDDERLSIEELSRFAQAGGTAICDPTNIGLGRNPSALARISKATGVHIVMGSGWYRERCYPSYVYQETPDQLASRLVSEFVSGVGGTGVRPGFIGEIGTERFHISPAEERVFRAVARAHKRVGCPIMTHTTRWGELALEQLDLLGEEGVDASAVIVSHLGDRPETSQVLTVAERGAWISIDNLASTELPDKIRVDNIRALWEEGFGHQVMLGNDICSLTQLASFGGLGYDNVIRRFCPLLREAHCTEEAIETMLVRNPSRAFGFVNRILTEPFRAEVTESQSELRPD